MSEPVLLCRTAAGAYVSTLPADRDLAHWHQALTGEIAAGLGLVHAAVLARPVAGPNGIEWIAQGDRVLPAEALPAPGRAALMAALGSILADIGLLSETWKAPLLASAWPALRRIPDEGFVYAVDGRPVLAGWGHAPAGATNWPDPLAPLLPARVTLSEVPEDAAPPPAPVPLKMIGVFLAAAFVIGLALPGFLLRPFTCAVPPAAAAALEQGNAAIAQNALLQSRLAQLDGQAALQKGQCPAPPQALPQQAWNQGKLDMLKGCWHLVSNLMLYDIKSGDPDPPTSWLFCFDASGNGQQTVTFKDGTSCTGPVQAKFDDAHNLLMAEPRRCDGSTFVVQAHWVCIRTNADQAACTRTDDEDKTAHSEGVFQR